MGIEKVNVSYTGSKNYNSVTIGYEATVETDARIATDELLAQAKKRVLEELEKIPDSSSSNGKISDKEVESQSKEASKDKWATCPDCGQKCAPGFHKKYKYYCGKCKKEVIMEEKVE